MRYKSFNYFIVISLILLAGFYGPLIFCNQNFFASDQGFYFEPLAKFIGNSLAQLQLPLWNPLLHCGMAQVAVPSPGIFYPPNWIFACLPYGQAFVIGMVFHQFVAGLFALLFILNLGWGSAAAFCCGIIVAFCGYMFSLTANYTLMATAAWVPLNFWLIDTLSRTEEQKNIYLLVCLEALAFFLLIAAGRPELSVPAALSIALLIGFKSGLHKARDQSDLLQKSRAHIRWQCFSLFIGLLLAMPVILPAAEWFRNSPRAQGLTIDTVFLWSANWYDFVSLVFAQPFGDLTSLGSPLLNLAASRPGYLPFVPSPLVGPVAFTLAILGFSDRSWRERKWLLLVLSLSFLMILGKNAQIFPQLLRHIPCINLFRYPIKLIIIPIFLLAVAAARGLYCLTQSFGNGGTSLSEGTHGVPLPITVLRTTGILWLVAFLIGCLFTTAGILAKPLPIHPLNKSAIAQLMLGQSLLLGSLIGLVICAVIYLFVKRRINLKWTVITINTLLVLSLYLPALCYRAKTVAGEFFANRPFVLDEIDKINEGHSDTEKQRILLLYKDPLALPKGYSWRKDSSYTVNYYAYCRNMLIPNTNLDWNQPMTLGYEAAETGDYRKLSLDLIQTVYPASSKVRIAARDYLALWHFCRASATTWLCGQTRNDYGKLPALSDAEHFQVVGENDNMNLRIYRVKNALSRAFICQKWSWAASHEDALSCLGGVNDSDFDPENAALIERLPMESKEYPVLLPAGYHTDQSPSLPLADGAQHGMPSNAVITQAGVIYPAAKSFASAPHLQSPVFLKDLPEHISISLNLDKDNFLILADQFYPGWTASVDGLKTPIFRANGCFRAVYVPRGGHLIQFDYEPLSLTIGLDCALAGSCLIGWLLLSALSADALRIFRRMAGEEI